MVAREYIKSASRKIYRFFRNPRRRRSSRVHRWLADRMFDRALWRPCEITVSRAVALGFFVGMFPIPFQMVVAGLLVAFLWTRAGLPVNLPTAVAAVWISNVATMAPIVYVQYRIGRWIDSWSPVPVVPGLDRAQALMIGVLLTAPIVAAIGFFGTRLLWNLIAKYLLHQAAPRQVVPVVRGGVAAGVGKVRRRVA